jgi:hypothetical protein
MRFTLRWRATLRQEAKPVESDKVFQQRLSELRRVRHEIRCAVTLADQEQKNDTARKIPRSKAAHGLDDGF